MKQIIQALNNLKAGDTEITMRTVVTAGAVGYLATTGLNDPIAQIVGTAVGGLVGLLLDAAILSIKLWIKRKSGELSDKGQGK